MMNKILIFLFLVFPLFLFSEELTKNYETSYFEEILLKNADQNEKTVLLKIYYKNKKKSHYLLIKKISPELKDTALKTIASIQEKIFRKKKKEKKRKKRFLSKNKKKRKRKRKKRKKRKKKLFKKQFWKNWICSDTQKPKNPNRKLWTLS